MHFIIIILGQAFQCDVCGLMIKSKKANLERHKRLHGPIITKLKCCGCEKTFSTQYNFEIHCEREHSKETTTVGVWVEENAKRKTVFQVCV